jgi:hypothetical protein
MGMKYSKSLLLSGLVEEVVLDDVPDGLQNIGGFVEDVVQQEVGLQGLMLVAEVEGVALIVHQTLQGLHVLRLFHLKMFDYHIYR